MVLYQKVFLAPEKLSLINRWSFKSPTILIICKVRKSEVFLKAGYDRDIPDFVSDIGPHIMHHVLPDASYPRARPDLCII